MNNMHECIQNCLNCYQICKETALHCLKMGGKHAEPEHLKLLLACSEMCLASANQMLYESPVHGLTCAACSQICQKCAEECQKMAQGEEMMQKCAQMCQKCAQTCGQMAA